MACPAGRLLLEEMDNIAHRNRGVVVIGATNCLEAIDPAFLRPGRYTYVLEVQRPRAKWVWRNLLDLPGDGFVTGRTARFSRSGSGTAPVLAPRREWLEHAFSDDETGLVEVARIAATKDIVGDDVREIIRRAIDERIMAGLDGIDLGPLSAADLRRHVQDYVVVRKV